MTHVGGWVRLFSYININLLNANSCFRYLTAYEIDDDAQLGHPSILLDDIIKYILFCNNKTFLNIY